jgi:hypothetical protein
MTVPADEAPITNGIDTSEVPVRAIPAVVEMLAKAVTGPPLTMRVAQNCLPAINGTCPQEAEQ